MAKPAQVLPPTDEHSDVDSLVTALRASDEEALQALRQPREGWYTPALPGKPLGFGARRVRCDASIADAVIEERKR